MSAARFRRSADGVTSLGFRLEWCSKYRRRVLRGRAAVRPNELLDKIAAKNKWEFVPQAVMPDPAHMFVRVRPTDSPAEVARKFNGRTFRMLLPDFPWLGHTPVPLSKTHFAASVGSKTTVRRYIEHQWDAVA